MRPLLYLAAVLCALLSLVGCNREGVAQTEPPVVCGYEEPPPPPSGIRLLAAAVAPAPVLGVRRVALVNGSASIITGTVGPFWSSASDGKATFEATTHNASVSASCDPRISVKSAIEALDSEIDWRTYHHVVLIASTSGCSYSGIGGILRDVTTNDGVVTIGYAQFSSSVSSFVAKHEFGHSLGLGHAASLTCVGGSFLPGGPDSCTRGEYGDSFSIMGGGQAVNAREKDFLGWWTTEEALASPAEFGRYTLAANSAHSGLRALKIPRTGAGDALYVEYGTSTGALLHVLATPLPNGAYSLIFDPDPATTGYALPAGPVFTDPGTGTTVRVVGMTAGVSLSVEVDPAPADAVYPTVAITSPASAATIVSGLTTLAATASDDRGLWRVRFFVNTGAGTRVTELSDYEAPYSVTWDAGAAASGTYGVVARAYDLAGNSSVVARSFTVAAPGTTSAPPLPSVTATVVPSPTVTAPPGGAATRTPTRTPTKKCRPRWRCP